MSVPNYVRVGSEIRNYPAGTHNWLVDRVQYLLSRQEEGQPPRGQSDRGLPRVHNSTGSSVVPFGIVKIDGPLNDPTDHSDEPYQGVRLDGAPPVDGDAFAVLQRSAAAGDFVSAVASGPTWVQIDVKSESDTTCGIIDGDTAKLESGKGSTPIIWKQSGTGVKWAIVQLGGSSASTEGATHFRAIVPYLAGSFAIPAGFYDGAPTGQPETPVLAAADFVAYRLVPSTTYTPAAPYVGAESPEITPTVVRNYYTKDINASGPGRAIIVQCVEAGGFNILLNADCVEIDFPAWPPA